MNETIAQVKSDFLMAKERLVAGLRSTPDDKLRWSPSASARTPLELAACGSIGTEGMMRAFASEPFPFASMEEMDAHSRAEEKRIRTREEAISHLERTSEAFVTWLEQLTPEKLESSVLLPTMGTMPLKIAITFPAGHLHCRACQLDYVQTIYGDLAWHS